MKPNIKYTKEILLVGKKISMSYSNNLTTALWKSFMPHRKEISNSLNTNLFSVEVYNSPNFFENFDPSMNFEKWAAVEVSNFSNIPMEMDSLIIPAGQYAVFNYKGKGSEASETYSKILQDWFPASQFRLDDRPHFAVMGEKYQHEETSSEEELWFPIKAK